MFSTRANTFLGVCGAFQLGKVRVGIYNSEEDGFVLIHASIGEEERRVVEGDNGGGRDWCHN